MYVTTLVALPQYLPQGYNKRMYWEAKGVNCFEYRTINRCNLYENLFLCVRW